MLSPDGTALLDAGEHRMAVIFTPADTLNYLPVDTVVSVFVGKLTQYITWSDELVDLQVGDTIVLTATTSSELEVTYFVSNDTVAYVSGDTIYIIAAGTVTITAMQEGNEIYNEALPIEVEVVVSKPSPTTALDAVEQYGELKAVYSVTGQLITTTAETELPRGTYIFLYSNGAKRVLVP